MRLGKGHGRSCAGQDEAIEGEFVLELVDGMQETDAAGNRYLRPIASTIVRFGFERGGRQVQLVETTMDELLDRIQSTSALQTAQD